jgi:hypothetical protein
MQVFGPLSVLINANEMMCHVVSAGQSEPEKMLHFRALSRMP